MIDAVCAGERSLRSVALCGCAYPLEEEKATHAADDIGQSDPDGADE
ncbi:hypothetical protein AA0488_2697 [Kozakia baliensis NRIC 0488]|nr:hypothetical protein AA0488_2697 [Kozakia baliensis NRIC 0488]